MVKHEIVMAQEWGEWIDEVKISRGRFGREDPGWLASRSLLQVGGVGGLLKKCESLSNRHLVRIVEMSIGLPCENPATQSRALYARAVCSIVNDFSAGVAELADATDSK